MSEPRLITALINSIFHWSLDSLYLSLCAFSHSSSQFQLPVALSVFIRRVCRGTLHIFSSRSSPGVGLDVSGPLGLMMEMASKNSVSCRKPPHRPAAQSLSSCAVERHRVQKLSDGEGTSLSRFKPLQERCVKTLRAVVPLLYILYYGDVM